MPNPQRCATCSTRLLSAFAAVACGARIRLTVLPTRHLRRLAPPTARSFRHTAVRLSSTITNVPTSVSAEYPKALEEIEKPQTSLEAQNAPVEAENIPSEVSSGDLVAPDVTAEITSLPTENSPEARSAPKETKGTTSEAPKAVDEATVLYKPGEAQGTPASPKADAVPWFLRVETPKAPRHPLAEREKLPNLPANPPPELTEMLQQLSEEHGITNLKLLDLRKLNPPPAIGSTIMILGNARSLRHLHATADRVCRFMRSHYNWQSFADGLLGRNELRLINRRKQRRGKVVSTEMGEVDEAGSAGWVCVNGGGQGVVVQLFTKQKREEMDLEGLWTPVLEQAERHRIAEAKRQAEREKKWAKEGRRKNAQQEAQVVSQEDAVPEMSQDIPENVAREEMPVVQKEEADVVQEAVEAVAPEAAPVPASQKEEADVVQEAVEAVAPEAAPVPASQKEEADVVQEAVEAVAPEAAPVSASQKEEADVVQEAVEAVAPEAAPVPASQKEERILAPGVAAEVVREAQKEQAAALNVGESEAVQGEVQQEADKIQPVQTPYTLKPSVSGPMVQKRSFHELTSSSSEGAATAQIDITAHPSFPTFLRTGDLSSFLSTFTTEQRLEAHLKALQSPLVPPTLLLGTSTSTNITNTTSTPFLRTFHQTLSAAPQEDQVKYTLFFLLSANTRLPSAYPIDSIHSHLESLRARGLPIKAEHYYHLAHHAATCAELRPTVEHGWQYHADKRAELIGTYVNALQPHTTDGKILHDCPEFRYAIFLALQKVLITNARNALLSHSWDPQQPLDLSLGLEPGEKLSFHPRIFSGKGLGSLSSPSSPYRYTLAEYHLDYLTALGLSRKYQAMWSVWKRLPLHGVVRDAEYYKLIFGLVVLGRRQDIAVYTARMAGLQAMDKEVPRVSFTGNVPLARAFMRVLAIADDTGYGGEYKVARSLCEEVIRRG